MSVTSDLRRQVLVVDNFATSHRTSSSFANYAISLRAVGFSHVLFHLGEYT